ncbi:uncharacterized protein LOC120104238 [Phoenix dactylifera]|uniref:Uncharacterized protein LOC120104238 n=1 Tax=Phoenix dactylifera TaxID=42345 RepID=A0A8B8ZA95_PHODC|nr:uncharacterized protein LOC120104238 [Phoenix dactylifera]
MSPFEVVYGYKARKPLDFLPMSPHVSIFESAHAFAHYIHELHQKIYKRIHASNAHYKLQVDFHMHDKEFQTGDYVMIHIQHERFPSRTVKKLQVRSTRPYRVLRRVGTNAYVIDLSSDCGISPTFNVKDLVVYKGPSTIPDDLFAEPFSEPDDLPIPDPIPASIPLPHQQAQKKQIDAILDDQTVFTSDGDIQRFLVECGMNNAAIC